MVQTVTTVCIIRTVRRMTPKLTKKPQSTAQTKWKMYGRRQQQKENRSRDLKRNRRPVLSTMTKTM